MPMSDVGAEDHRRDPGGEAVEAVGEVHPVGRAGDHEVGPDDEQEHPADGAREGEVDVGVADERDERRGGSAELVVAEVQREDREDHADGDLAGQLLLRAQAQAALLGDLDEVVEEADDPQPGHEEEDEQAAHRGQLQGHQVRGRVGDEHRAHDDGAAHRRRAALGVVRRGAVVADELAVAALDEEPDEHRRPEQSRDERDSAGDEDALHAGTSIPTRRSPSQRRPASRLDLSSTTSPAGAATPAASYAASASATRRTRWRARHGWRRRRRRPHRRRRRRAGRCRARRPSRRPARARCATGRPARASRRGPPRSGGARRPVSDRAQRLESGAHRVGVGVVGVVDDGDTVGAFVDLHPPPAGGLGRASAAATRRGPRRTRAPRRRRPARCRRDGPPRAGG